MAALFFISICGNKNISKGFKAFVEAIVYNNATKLGFGKANGSGFLHCIQKR